MKTPQNQRQQSFHLWLAILATCMIFPRMTSFIENSRWRPDLLKACISEMSLKNFFKNLLEYISFLSFMYEVAE